MCFCSRDANISSKQQWNYRNMRLGWYSWTDCDFSHVSVFVCTILLVQEGGGWHHPSMKSGVWCHSEFVSAPPHPYTKQVVWLTSPHTVSPHDSYTTHLLTQSVHPTNTLHTNTHNDNRSRCSRENIQVLQNILWKFLRAAEHGSMNHCRPRPIPPPPANTKECTGCLHTTFFITHTHLTLTAHTHHIPT